jgi:hypothetical protein
LKESEIATDVMGKFKLQFKSQAELKGKVVNDDDLDKYANKLFEDMYEYYTSKYDEREEEENKKALDIDKENEAFETIYKQTSNDLGLPANISINLKEDKLIPAEFIQLADIKKMLKNFTIQYRKLAESEESLIKHNNYNAYAAAAYDRF